MAGLALGTVLATAALWLCLVATKQRDAKIASLRDSVGYYKKELRVQHDEHETRLHNYWAEIPQKK